MNSQPIQAVQQIRRMRGGAQAHLMRASDKNFYIVKFQNNPQHTRVLANELIASRIGQALGLPIPRTEVLEVDDWLIEHTQELRIDFAGQQTLCSSGLQLGSRFVADPETDSVFDYLPESLSERICNFADFARVLVLDKWLANADGRQAVFTKKPRARHYSVHFIDQGYCFNAGEWTFADLALQGVYYRNHVYQHVTGWESFEPVLSRAETMDLSRVWELIDDIPDEWYEGNTDALCRILDALNQRRPMIRDLNYRLPALIPQSFSELD